MTFIFWQVYSDPMPTETPTLFSLEAESTDEAVGAVAKRHGWKLTSWEGHYAWYQIAGRDMQYSIRMVHD